MFFYKDVFMKNGSSNGSFPEISDSAVSSLSSSSSPAPLSDDAKLIEAIEQAMEELNLVATSDTNKYFSGFDEMAEIVKKRPDLIQDRLFHLVFMYVKAYFDDTQDRKCTEHLVAVLKSGNQYSAKNLRIVFLWSIKHELEEVLAALLFQQISFIHILTPHCFSVFISSPNMSTFLEDILFSRWSAQTLDLETLSIFKELFIFTARKGTPKMLNVFLKRCDFLRNSESIIGALEMAISECNVENVVFLWGNRSLDAYSKKRILAEIVKERHHEMLQALQKEEASSTFYEKFILRVAQMCAAGGLTIENANIILSMVEAYVAVMVALDELAPHKKRAYYIKLGLELIEDCKQLSQKAKEEAQKSQGVSQEFLNILDDSTLLPSMASKKHSLLNEILSPNNAPRRMPSQDPLIEQSLPSNLIETFMPLRTLSKERLQEESLEEVKQQLEQSTLQDKERAGIF